MKRKLIALATDRTALNAAQAALEADNQTEYSSQMEKVANLNAEIERVQNLIAEQERQVLTAQPSAAEVRDMAAERGTQLLNHQSVRISNAEIRRALRNSTDGVLLGGTLVQPTGADSEIHGDSGAISSILDMVQVQDLAGLGGYEVPYVVSEFDGTVANITSKSGEARSVSTDPVFGIAPVKPVEITTTSYVEPGELLPEGPADGPPRPPQKGRGPDCQRRRPGHGGDLRHQDRHQQGRQRDLRYRHLQHHRRQYAG